MKEALLQSGRDERSQEDRIRPIEVLLPSSKVTLVFFKEITLEGYFGLKAPLYFGQCLHSWVELFSTWAQDYLALLEVGP